MQRRTRDRSIRREEAQHRCHFRVNHAGALGDPGNADRPAAVRDFHRHFLGESVRRHDGLRGIISAMTGDVLQQFLDPGFNLHNRQRLANASRGTDEDVVIGASQPTRHGDCHGPGVDHAVGARASVGIAAVGDNGAGLAALDVLPVEFHRRRLDLVRGERGRHGRRMIRYNQGKIFLPVALDASGDACRPEPERRCYRAFDLFECWFHFIHASLIHKLLQGSRHPKL